MKLKRVIIDLYYITLRNNKLLSNTCSRHFNLDCRSV